MMRLPALILVTIFFANAYAQSPPNDASSPEYREAYDLLFDLRARGLKAERILLRDGKKSPQDLSMEELFLLCSAYNQSAESEKQLAIASLIFEKYPENILSSLRLSDSLLSLVGRSKTPEDIVRFADSTLKDRKGNRRVFLLMKARGIVMQEAGITDEQKKEEVTKLLLEVAKEPKEKDLRLLSRTTPEYFIETDSILSRYFSREERIALKGLIAAAVKEKQQAEDVENIDR